MNVFDSQPSQISQNNNEQEFVKRGRGRPKKNQIMGYEKKKKPLDNVAHTNVHVKEAPLTKVKDEIILHFPLISLSDISRVNVEYYPKEKKNDLHDIFTINDGNYSTSDCNNDSEPNNIVIIELKQQLEEQKGVISNLHNEITNYKTLLNKYDLANRNVSKINVLLINVDNNAIIIPETTEVACWWCGYNFTDTQCILPENVYSDIWYVSGNYCCVECSAADNFARNDSGMWNRYSLLKQMYTLEQIIPTPDKRVFTKYGGPIIYEDFKKNSHKCDRVFRLIMPPMASIVPLVEESVVDSTRVSVTMNDLKRNAKLKRTKPLPNVKDNLFR